MTDKKQCTMCKEIKPKDMFYRNTSASDGRMSECKDCRRVIYSTRYTAKKKENQLNDKLFI